MNEIDLDFEPNKTKSSSLPVIYNGDCRYVMQRDIDPLSIDFIYLDPPFFTGAIQRAGWKPDAMEMSYEDTKKFWDSKSCNAAPVWMHELALKHHELASYLWYMKLRLLQCNTVLKDTGIISLHCDWRAGHYLRFILDEIFGYKNFINEIIWERRGWTPNTNYLRRKHDTIFIYAKTKNYTFNQIREPLNKLLEINEESIKYIKHALEKQFKEDDGDGRKYFWNKRPGPKSKGQRIYLDEGTALRDIWHISPVLSNTEKRNYPSQKPQALLQLLIKVFSNPRDIVLDPFLGGGSTIIAAKKLNRRHIGIEINITGCKETQKWYQEEFNEHIPITHRRIENVLDLYGIKFQKWVNNFYKTTTAKPDLGVDEITKNGIPIQVKTVIINRDIVAKFINDAKYHPKIPQPLKEVILISSKGFSTSASKRKYQTEKTENIKVTFIGPDELKELLKVD